MEVRILHERANPLMHRKELTFEVEHAGAATPPRAEVRKELAKLVNVPADRLVIERMRALFGVAKSHGEAMAYATKEAADVTVREHILVRNGLREKAAPTPPTPAGEAPATPAPKEEPKPAPSKGGAEPGATGKEHPKSEQPKAEPTKPEHPTSEHPKAEHPKSEHPKSEHPKGEHGKAEHGKGEGHKPELPTEPHTGDAPKSEKPEHGEKTEEKAGKPEKSVKHSGKTKTAHEPKTEG